MQTNFFFKHCTEEEKKLFNNYFAKKLEHMQETMERANILTLDVTLERFPTKSAYKVTFNADSTHGQFYAYEDDHTIAEAVDLAKDKFERQLKKALDKEQSH